MLDSETKFISTPTIDYDKDSLKEEEKLKLEVEELTNTVSKPLPSKFMHQLQRRFMYLTRNPKFFPLLFVFLQLIILVLCSYSYYISPVHNNLRKNLGLSFVVARGSALSLYINTSFILIPISRNLIRVLRATYLNRIVNFDSNVSFHKYLGYSCVVLSLIHTGCHLNNFYVLASKPGNRTFLGYNLETGPGLTGWLMLLLLTIIFITSLKYVRNLNFELFYYSHHLFLVYFLIFSIHGSFCLLKTDKTPYCSKDGSQFYKFISFSLLLYLTERFLREIRGFNLISITKVVVHQSKVIELQFERNSKLKVKPGQWLYLNVPTVSLYQWHPFTITSAPEEGYLSVHIRVVGDFTKKLSDSLTELNGKPLPKVVIDGPFGSASEDVFDYRVAVLIGAGIGVTPFASILKSIWYRVNYPQSTCKLSKVYFVWICRDKEAFEWFHDLLKAIEAEDLDQFIDIQIYMTGKFQLKETQHLLRNPHLSQHDAKLDPLTGLRATTNYGRPNLDLMFRNYREKHPNVDIGTFFCGPYNLGNMLRECAEKFNFLEDGTKTRFHFGKENF